MINSNKEHPVFLFMTRMGDCIWMSILWIITCLPIITIGAATTAMIRNMMHLRQDKESGTGFYFRSFGENFKEATICWILLALAAGVLFLADYFAGMLPSRGICIGIRILSIYLFLVLLIVQIYTFPLLSYFKNTVAGTLKNALIIGILHPACTILCIFFLVAPVICAFFLSGVFFHLLPAWIFIWPGLAAYVLGGMYEKVFRKYAPEDCEASSRKSNEIQE